MYARDMRRERERTERETRERDGGRGGQPRVESREKEKEHIELRETDFVLEAFGLVYIGWFNSCWHDHCQPYAEPNSVRHECCAPSFLAEPTPLPRVFD